MTLFTVKLARTPSEAGTVMILWMVVPETMKSEERQVPITY